MKKALLTSFFVLLFTTCTVSADTFGTGENQFDIELVTISGDASSANGTNISQYATNDSEYRAFADPGSFRMGKYEITNNQWNSFKTNLGIPVTGSPSRAYSGESFWTGETVPTNNVSWYETAQFVNWLNTSKGYSVAYKFIGIQGTSNYKLTVWESGDPGYNVQNPYRNSNAFYFLPTEDEWVKAAYWNGRFLQTYATPNDIVPAIGVDANYGWKGDRQPWSIGSGIEELNGTFDMMGNVWEWMESPFWFGSPYGYRAPRTYRGSSYNAIGTSALRSTWRYYKTPRNQHEYFGFRIASVIPKPASMGVSIDIKPQSCPNPLNVQSNGVLPAAIIGSEVLDVNDIDPNSLEILGVRPIRSSYEDVAAPVAEEALPEDCLCTTEGPDGYLDLTLKFDTQAIIEAIGEVEDGEMIILTLTGSLQDGTPIEGTDCILIRKKGKQ